MYKVLIVDDEHGALSILSRMISNFPGYEVVAELSSPENLQQEIVSLKPDILFLDIHLGNASGVDIARDLYNDHCETRIVFVSAFDKYAIQAFEYNIIDYILKPVSRDRIEKCLKKFEQTFSNGNPTNQQTIEKKEKGARSLRFNTQNGFLLVDPDEIIFLEADHVYTKIALSRQNSHYVAQNIGRILSTLNDQKFLRISRSHAINARFLREVNRTQKKCLLFDGTKEYELSLTKMGLQNMDHYFG